MSDNLALIQVVESQTDKEVTINDQAAELDAALTAKLALAIDSSNARPLTDTELRRHFFFDLDPDGGDPPNAAITLTVPSGISRGLFAVINDTGFDVTVEITGQVLTPPAVADGEAAPLTSDGVDVRLAGGGGGAGVGSAFYDIGFLYSGGPPGASELLFKWIATRDLNYLNLISVDLEVRARDPEAWAILLDGNGNLCEGLGSNIFVSREGRLLTPRERFVLPGVSRATVIELARELEIPFAEADIDLYDAYTAEEAFITSTSLCICPVRSVNGTTLGESVPGPLTSRLTEAYARLVDCNFVAQHLAHLT